MIDYVEPHAPRGPRFPHLDFVVARNCIARFKDRSISGSLAMLAAMRRASSRRAAERRERELTWALSTPSPDIGPITVPLHNATALATAMTIRELACLHLL
jgi:hypothetical protein